MSRNLSSLKKRRPLFQFNVAVVAVSACLFLGSAGAFAGVPQKASAPDLPQEQLAAIGKAGTVYLSGTWAGYVSYPTVSGDFAWSDEVYASFSCTGFVASSDGYIVTAGHCADPAEGKVALVDQFLLDQESLGNISAAEAQDFVNNGAETNWVVEGKRTGDDPVLQMQVIPALSISEGDGSGLTAILVDDRPLDKGDSALFKIDSPLPLPVLKLSAEEPQTGQSVNAIGYPGNVTDLVTSNLQPTFTQGQVSGRQQTSGGPFTQIGIAMSPGMSGGPVINGQGEVVGTVSFGPSGDTQQLNFATARDTISAILSRNGVKNELSEVDQLFRKGLNEYFTGHYHDAARDLGTVVARDSNNTIAKTYQNKAIENFPQENTTGWIIWVVIAVVVVLVIAALLTVLLVMRGRKRKQTVAVGVAPVPGTEPFQAAPAAAVGVTQPPVNVAPPAAPTPVTGNPEAPAVVPAPVVESAPPPITEPPASPPPASPVGDAPTAPASPAPGSASDTPPAFPG